MKVAKVVSAKCALAARVDSAHSNPEGDFGESKTAHDICLSLG